MRQDLNAKVNLFLQCLETCDFSRARALCTDRATVWQNDGNGAQGIGESLEQFKVFAADVKSLRYDVIRRFHSSNEVFQQHVLHLNMVGGSFEEVHAVVYFRFEDDLIERIEECIYTMPKAKAP
ncbi:nuclear transport factor 2 family protein [Streptomyces sp. BE147]|uniref:nuclear transport factor 2 family protein n=1 Tax=Streptomyces sp. BE147 TaxID=3002524 RepID=UPI002E79D72E|nr:nuclear transport factor 2 family protein [Streptomyces sp. BE147]MEE1742411.1 nuclear transport factor 2 family protein [Streptomyces sp. BE147]